MNVFVIWQQPDGEGGLLWQLAAPAGECRETRSVKLNPLTRTDCRSMRNQAAVLVVHSW